MIPIALSYSSPELWRRAVLRFAEVLRGKFGSRLSAVIALPRPELSAYDSNVLVVLSREEPSDIHTLTEAVLAVEEELKLEGEISPIITTEEDKRMISVFTKSQGIKLPGHST